MKLLFNRIICLNWLTCTISIRYYYSVSAALYRAVYKSMIANIRWTDMAHQEEEDSVAPEPFCGALIYLRSLLTCRKYFWSLSNLMSRFIVSVHWPSLKLTVQSSDVMRESAPIYLNFLAHMHAAFPATHLWLITVEELDRWSSSLCAVFFSSLLFSPFSSKYHPRQPVLSDTLNKFSFLCGETMFHTHRVQHIKL